MARVFAPSWGRPPAGASGGGPAAPATPATTTPAAAAYSTANLPPDASYEQVVAQLQRQRDEGLAALAGERVRGLSDYGFQEGPNGVLTFDVNNPLSKASLLKKAYDTNRRSTGNQMAAGGQLYSGARQNALDLVSRNQLQAEDAQQKALQAFLAGNTGRRKEALSNYEIAAGQAYGDRLSRFETNPLYQPSAADSQAEAAPASGPAAAAKPKRKPRFRPFQPSWRR